MQVSGIKILSILTLVRFAYSNIIDYSMSGLRVNSNLQWTTPSATPLVYLNGVELKTSQFSIISSNQIVVENVSVGDQI